MIQLSKYLYSIVIKRSSIPKHSYIELFVLPSMSDIYLASPGSYTNWANIDHVCQILESNNLKFGIDYVIIDERESAFRDKNYNITTCDWLDYDRETNICRFKNDDITNKIR